MPPKKVGAKKTDTEETNLKKAEKIEFLKKVLERKQILFGSFSPTLTAKDKERNWKNIRDELIAKGSSLAANDWKKLSTVTWQYCRRSTVAKIDNRKISG